MNQKAPFARDRVVDKPGIVGARWWHEALADEASKMARRDAIRNILIASGVIAGFGAAVAMCVHAASTPSAADVTEQRQTSLDMQRQYGWNFGAVGEPLVFDGITQKPFDPSALLRDASGLRRRDYAPRA